MDACVQGKPAALSIARRRNWRQAATMCYLVDEIMLAARSSRIPRLKEEGPYYMTDVVDVATRSRMMAGIKGRNTLPEMVLRRELHRLGYRFRLHRRGLPGRPDLLLPKWKVAILVHGCFWHRHPGCRKATTPATRPQFWSDKFAANVARDVRNHASLLLLGWRVATVWECALQPQRLAANVDALSSWIRRGTDTIEIG